MMKNPTPRQIALASAILLSAYSLVFYIGVTNLEFVSGWLAWILFPLTILGLAYLVNLYYLKKYIYRKVKLIYKTIHRHKRSPDEKAPGIDVDNNIIEEVEKEVNAWAAIQQQELDRFRAWADYRRKFVGDISHELKTPIFTIQGYLHTLLDGGLYDDKVNMTFLKKAAKNVDRLYTIVEDLSAIARLEAGNLVLEMQAFDIKELTEEIFEDLEIKAREKEIILEFKDGASQNYKVLADREYIRQVLTNLIHNSIKYGNSGGKTKVGFYDMDKNMLIEVADNGIGIPKNHLLHVFDRFYRVDKSRSRAQGGSGLGLSIVKHIIEAHKQTINVRSTPGVGSTFGFTLEKA
ncbi:sensor histidine kinase [Flavilitoribacter nigricans]|uniref:histidine kinase n=1 Tax=Flavilitoribacter nigricans (strain ATCC 23147 / DSM 23189 / NBRC 102662 / NCIMB 1420 / SS-2) TaxID=1122177 RepID=A0A2D0NJM7_FLAN2|nr:ATP-binding protein [Flavilitoribacter nigricans]PHN08702.1 two-component sensor histidine kinase [Flavilitoribacter nigricans DSM 23189 = NBRC 102662]